MAGVLARGVLAGVLARGFRAELARADGDGAGGMMMEMHAAGKAVEGCCLWPRGCCC